MKPIVTVLPLMLATSALLSARVGQKPLQTKMSSAQAGILSDLQLAATKGAFCSKCLPGCNNCATASVPYVCCDNGHLTAVEWHPHNECRHTMNPFDSCLDVIDTTTSLPAQVPCFTNYGGCDPGCNLATCVPSSTTTNTYCTP